MGKRQDGAMIKGKRIDEERGLVKTRMLRICEVRRVRVLAPIRSWLEIE